MIYRFDRLLSLDRNRDEFSKVFLFQFSSVYYVRAEHSINVALLSLFVVATSKMGIRWNCPNAMCITRLQVNLRILRCRSVCSVSSARRLGHHRKSTYNDQPYKFMNRYFIMKKERKATRERKRDRKTDRQRSANDPSKILLRVLNIFCFIYGTKWA